jgi:UDP-3-O-[3-hydroxymyristoyl] N-acetylglucosamine deacetylase
MNAQRTLRRSVSCTGIGLHSGNKVTLSLKPAPADYGIRFQRADLGGLEIPATVTHLGGIQYQTGLTREAVSVETVEHLLAALTALSIDNAIVELNSPEVPIMDGSAAAFVAAIDQAGIVTQSAARRFIQVLKPVQVTMGDSFGELRPHAAGFRAEVEIDFANPVIGRQSYMLDLNPERFRREISRARTFGCMNDVARLWSAGFALGASFENSVVFDETRLLNTEGLRYSDECARHKVLDVIGDLALAGLPLLGAFRSVRGGHKLNHAVLCALMSDTSAWTWVEGEIPRPITGHAEMASRLAPAFGPDRS